MWKKKQAEEVKGDGYCPHCEAELIEVGPTEDFNGESYKQDFTCNECGADGFLVYEYTFRLANYKIEKDK